MLHTRGGELYGTGQRRDGTGILVFAASGGALLFRDEGNETTRTSERQGECDDMDGNPVCSGRKQAILAQRSQWTGACRPIVCSPPALAGCGPMRSRIIDAGKKYG